MMRALCLAALIVGAACGGVVVGLDAALPAPQPAAVPRARDTEAIERRDDCRRAHGIYVQPQPGHAGYCEVSI